MKITEITGKTVSVQLTKPFKVTFGEIRAMESLILKITTDTGLVGYGEACPFELVTGENIATEKLALADFRPILIGQDPRDIEQRHADMDHLTVGHTALKAGIDIALYDLLGKATGLPLYQLLGGQANRVKTDITIAIDTPSAMAAEAQRDVARGFTQLKVKTGLNVQTDIQAIQQILAVVDDRVEVKVDANQGWTAKQTIDVMDRFQHTNLKVIEQPLPYWQHPANALIRQHISQSLMLDESVHSAHDAFAVLQVHEADLINIKLMKSAGILGAEQINHVAAAAGVPCMIGCMAESSIAICAAAHFAAAHANITYCDLDSFLMFQQPDWLRDAGFTTHHDVIQLSERPGLGVELAF